MTPRTRTVTGTVYHADMTPWADDTVTIYLRDGGTDGEVSFPPGGVSTTTSELGAWEFEDLWCNEEGLERSSYLLVEPGNRTVEFTLPYEDGSTITIEELEARGIIPDWATSWTGNALTSFMANLASIVNRALGSNLVGWLAAGVGAVGKTVRDKLDERITTADYTTFAQAVTAAAGKTLRVNTAVTTGTTTVPSTVTLKFERSGSITVSGGGVLTINGAIEAGRHQIFAGAGTVTGTPKIDAVYPEWFGAAGVDMAIDTPAFEKAAAFHPVVRGDSVTEYLIDTQYQTWTLLDLHKAGRWREGGWSGATNFTDGYSVGVIVSRTTIIEDCHFILDTQGIATQKAHAFGFGDPTSATRMDGGGFRRCAFSHVGDLPVEPVRPHCALFQSVDNAIVEHCTFTGEITLKDLESIHAGTGLPKYKQIVRLAGFSFYDCHDSRVSNNHWYACQVAAIYEFCDRPHFNANQMRMCSTGVDLDKRCTDFVAIGNTIENDEDDTITLTQYIERMSRGDTDAWIEANGCDGMTLRGNRARFIQRHLIANNKADVYTSWDKVLEQSQDEDDYNYTVSQHVSHDDDVQGTWLSGFHMGASWEDETYIDPDTGEEVTLPSAHDGTMCGDDYVINSRYVDCGKGYNSGTYSAVVLIHEGTGIRFGPDFLIDRSASENTGAAGVYARSSYTISGSPVGATTYSNLRIESFAGTIRNTTLEAFVLDTPGRVVFAGLSVRGCGTETGGGGREAFLFYPERRAAMISGDLLVDPDGETLTKGLQIRSTTFKTGLWRVDASDFRIRGHDDDLDFDDTIVGSEAVSSQCIIYRPQLPLPIWPAHLSSTTQSPAWNIFNGAVTIRWRSADASQNLAYVQFRVPENIVGNALTVRCRLRSSSSEVTEIRTSRASHAIGGSVGWDATEVLADSATVTTTWADMTVATLTNMVAGQLVVLGFRPTAASAAALTSNKDILAVWIE